jgi:hypothetical protein
MTIAYFCRKVGWTYEEYLAQPAWFVERWKMMIEADAEYNKLQNNNAT